MNPHKWIRFWQILCFIALGACFFLIGRMREHSCPIQAPCCRDTVQSNPAGLDTPAIIILTPESFGTTPTPRYSAEGESF